MKHEIADERLQDYVDGRLGEKERAEVEALLRENPEAAKRVEVWREMGRALRADETELSPGFYTRTRARFEASNRTGLPRGFRRLLSWEAAGLAAAVVLAGVLFAPEVLRREEPTSVPARSATTADAELGKDSGEAVDSAPIAKPERLREVVTSPDLQAAPRDEEKRTAPSVPSAPGAEKEGRGASIEAEEPGRFESDFAPDPEKEGARRQAARAPAAVPAEVLAETADDVADRDDALRAELEKGAPPAKPAPMPRQKKSEPQLEAVGEVFADASTESGFAPEPVAIGVVAIPESFGDLDGARTVDDADEWRSLLDAPGGNDLRVLGEPNAEQRLVLVGRPAGVDCNTLRVTDEPDGYRVVLAPGGSSSGCGFLLPRDGRNIVLAMPGEPR